MSIYYTGNKYIDLELFGSNWLSVTPRRAVLKSILSGVRVAMLHWRRGE